MPKILFLSEACLLDLKSGGAHSVRAMLYALAVAGWQARAVTLSLCDGEAEYPLGAACPELDPATRAGSAATVADGPVTHRVQVAHSTRHRALRPWELRAYHELAEAELAAFRPDLVLCASSQLLHPLLARAQRLGARTVFYLANAGHLRAGALRHDCIDELLAPSQALADLCREKLGLAPRVVGDIVARPFDGRRNLAPERIAARRRRWVTMVNPEPAKGGLFFINIAAQLAATDPDLRLRAVESRWGRADWAARGVPAEALDRIDWQPATAGMARIYDEAALLLAPSLVFEASGRVIAEALLAGVPVLAMRTGGIPEQVNDGGFLFDLPPALAEDPLAAPDAADVQAWAMFVRVLMKNDTLYASAVDLALKAGAKHDSAARAAQAVAVFEALLAQPAPADPACDAETRAALQAQRGRMAAERTIANAQVTASEAAGGAAPRDTPYRALLQRSLAQPAMQDALAASKAKDWPRVRAILGQYLRLLPEDIAALGLLADAAEAQGQEAEARDLLERVAELAPGFAQARQRLVALLQRQGDVQAALAHSFALVEHAPDHLALHAGLLAAARRHGEAAIAYEELLRRGAGQAHDWTRYGHALQALGREDEAAAAWRRAIGLAPGQGAAWQALAALEPAGLGDGDIALMEQQLARDDLGGEDRAGLHFALGGAQEARGAWQPSFAHYDQARRMRSGHAAFDAGRIEDGVAQAKEVFTRAFFEARRGCGDPAPGPVFVLGLHAADTARVARGLARHGAIENLGEPPHLLRMAGDFGGGFAAPGPDGRAPALNAALLADMGPAEWAALGRQYLGRCAAERRGTRPLFVDGMPANWLHLGLVHLMLPGARIVALRRAPMAAGFALFASAGGGPAHAFDQRGIARCCRAYDDLMAHFDAVLPGRVHHVQCEALAADPEAAMRGLLAHCGLPFEAACLDGPRAWDAAARWRRYEPWLGPMREEFGDLLAAEPEALPCP